MFKALQSLLLEEKVRYSVTASRIGLSQFVLSLKTPPESARHPTPTSPRHHAHAHAHTLLSSSSLFLLPTFNSYNQPTHSTICFLHSLALTSALSLASSPRARSILSLLLRRHRSPCSSLQQAISFIRPALCRFVSQTQSYHGNLSRNNPASAPLNLTVDHDADFDVLRLPISPTHTALDLPHSNSQHQR